MRARQFEFCIRDDQWVEWLTRLRRAGMSDEQIDDLLKRYERIVPVVRASRAKP